jgi:sugar lactone lactonase YvrE
VVQGSRAQLSRVSLVGAATAVASLAIAAGALAAVGDLTPQGCIADVGDAAGCGATAEGLDGAFEVAMSPDGASVYAVSTNDDAIVRFDRAANGALSNPSCIEDVETNGACDDVGAAGEAQGLNGAAGVAVSADGASVYAVSLSDDAIVRFDRAANGALSNPSCIEDVETNGACDDVGAAGEAQGLNFATSVAVSADGASVYAVSQGDTAIVRFDRAANGALSNPSCIEDVETNGACDDVGAAGEAQGLGGAFDVAVSPDGASVYASGGIDDAIVRFDRAANGALSNPSCFEDVGPPNNGCGATAQGLDGTGGVAVSPDGASVYTVSINDNAIVRFDRAANGALSNPSCIADTGDFPAGCGATAQGLGGAQGVAVSPDGASVYVTSIIEDAIVNFDRAANGALSNPSCIADTGDPTGCGATQGLNGAAGVAVSADGASVYAVALFDDAIVRFDRVEPETTPPQTSIDTGPAEGSSTNDPTPSFGFSSSEGGSSFECRIYPGTTPSGSFGPCSGPGATHTPASPLPDGQHTFEVRATDPADNTDPSPASRTFTVDTVPPQTSIDTGPAAGSTTNDSTPTFGFSSSEGGSSFACRVDGGEFFACTSPGTIGPLGDGPHNFEVRATDAAGNADASSASRAFIVSGSEAAKADRTLTLTANKSKVPKGKKVTFSGRIDAPAGSELACEAGQTVELQRRKSAQASFQTFEQVQTDPTGDFSTNEKVTKTFEYRAQVAETATCLGQTSNTEKVKVKKKK